MKPNTWHPLAVAPGTPHDASQRALHGTYEGALSDASLLPLAREAGLGRLGRVRTEKRWQWFGAMDERMALGGAVVRMGYVSQVFVWIFDRQQGRMVFERSATLPPMAARVSDRPGEGVVASAVMGSGRVKVERQGLGARISARWGELRLHVVLEAHAAWSPITAICEVPGSLTNITQKQAGLKAIGQLSLGKKKYALHAEALGFLDYTHGLMAHRTAWWWAIGAGALVDGTRFAFNLVDGFNEGRENVLWLGDAVYKVPHATFETGECWRVSTHDERIELELVPQGVRAEEVILGPLGSRYEQPLGAWTGSVDGVAIASAVGVAERHVAKW